MAPMGRRRNNFGLIMLGMQVVRFGYDRIPPCTLTLLIACVVLSLDLVPAEFLRNLGFYTETDLMLIPSLVVHNLELSRVVTSLLYHAQEWHLYYNMTSLLWKGSSLERAVGTKRHVAITLLLGVISQFLYIGCAYARQQYLGDATSMHTALCGFSGVLFGYKVLLTQGAPPEHMSALMGILPLQTRYLVWGELLLMHFMFPNSSFVAHLCGIVAALMIAMGWFDSLITLADLLPDIVPNQPPVFEHQQQEVRHDNHWQGQAPLYAAGGAPPAGQENVLDEEGDGVRRREEIRRRALAAADARRHR